MTALARHEPPAEWRRDSQRRIGRRCGPTSASISRRGIRPIGSGAQPEYPDTLAIHMDSADAGIRSRLAKSRVPGVLIGPAGPIVIAAHQCRGGHGSQTSQQGAGGYTGNIAASPWSGGSNAHHGRNQGAPQPTPYR